MRSSRQHAHFRVMQMNPLMSHRCKYKVHHADAIPLEISSQQPKPGLWCLEPLGGAKERGLITGTSRRCQNAAHSNKARSGGLTSWTVSVAQVCASSDAAEPQPAVANAGGAGAAADVQHLIGHHLQAIISVRHAMCTV